MSFRLDTSYDLYAATVTIKLMKDFVDPLPAIIMNSVLFDKSIAQEIVQYTIAGMYSRAKKYYKYGERSYTRGLLEGNTVDVNIHGAAIRELVQGQTTNKIQLLYYNYATDFQEYVVHTTLQGMDGYTNTNGVITVTDEISPSHTLLYVGYAPSETSDDVVVEFTNYADQVYPMYIPYPYPPSQTAYVAKYIELGSDLLPIPNAQELYWIHINTADTPPIFGEAELGTLPINKYMPVIPFYEDQVNYVTSDKIGSELYRTSKQLIHKLGISYEGIAADIATGAADSIGQDKGLFAHFQLAAEVTAGALVVVDPTETFITYAPELIPSKVAHYKPHQATLHYLFEFFYALSFTSKYTRQTFANNASGNFNDPLRMNTIQIHDPNYKLTFSYIYIEVSTQSGVLLDGTTDFVTSEVRVRNLPEELSRFTLAAGSGDGDLWPVIGAVDLSILILRKQITASTFTQIIVCGLVQDYSLLDRTSATVILIDAFKPENPVFMTMPLNYALIHKIPRNLRNQLIHHSMCVVFNSYMFQKVQWYQQPFFEFLVLVVSLYFAIPSGGTSLTVWGAVKAVVYILLINLVTKYIIAPAFKWLAKELGADVAAILAAILIIISLFTKNPKLASALFDTGRAVFQGVNLLVKEMMQDLQKDYARLKSESEKLEEELKRAEGLFDRDMLLDIDSMVNAPSGVIWGEQPQEFIEGRLQLPTLTSAITQIPSVYVDLMLTLPSVNETLNFR